ncbi:hypothetical protein DRI50_04190 [candidate division KSB1 bacterium]|jgi:hypothetical protein|nr:MAG: hypothetical protein DRI50_04190 [candidate division KSB1 bacterium]
MYRFNKHFTLQQARDLLPLIKKNFLEIQRIHRKLEAVGFDVLKGKYKPGFHPDTLEPYPRLYHRFIHLMRQLLDKGIQIKSLQQGVFDFPAIRDNGDEVFLCWQSDEPDILFWHELEDGFQGRRSVDVF